MHQLPPVLQLAPPSPGRERPAGCGPAPTRNPCSTPCSTPAPPPACSTPACRAMLEIDRPGCVVNLGVGMPEGVAVMVATHGHSHPFAPSVTLTTEVRSGGQGASRGREPAGAGGQQGQSAWLPHEVTRALRWDRPLACQPPPPLLPLPPAPGGRVGRHPRGRAALRVQPQRGCAASRARGVFACTARRDCCGASPCPVPCNRSRACGAPAADLRFAHPASAAACLVPTATMIDFYNGGGVDLAVLGLAEVRMRREEG